VKPLSTSPLPSPRPLARLALLTAALVAVVLATPAMAQVSNEEA